MADVLKLNGDWTQPGGGKKLFASGDITLIWRKTKYLLSVDGRKSVEVSSFIVLFERDSKTIYRSLLKNFYICFI